MTPTLQAFRPITLAELNEKSAMLERIDHKYIVPAGKLHAAWPRLAELFVVLDINGRRTFRYATRYYDDRALRNYFDHHQGRRKRCKVRVRDYVDAGSSYLEVKLKDRRDATIKKRLKLDAAQGKLDTAGMTFVRRCYQDLYGEPFDHQLRPVITMRYKRITLVARSGGERMTLDAALEFVSPDCRRSVDPSLFIIETKSAHGNGIADRILRELHLHPTSRCSKYCIGMAATGQVTRHNRFLPAMRRLGLLEARTSPGRPAQPPMDIPVIPSSPAVAGREVGSFL